MTTYLVVWSVSSHVVTIPSLASLTELELGQVRSLLLSDCHGAPGLLQATTGTTQPALA